jgi:hypothetical protein
MTPSASELADLALGNEGVFLGKLLLLALFVVELAIVLLSIAMLSTEHKVALAGETQKAYLAVAGPAQALVSLNAEVSLSARGKYVGNIR